jgi:serralysin
MVRLLKLRSGTSAETLEINAHADFIGAGQAAALLNGNEARPFGPTASVIPSGLVGQLNVLTARHVVKDARAETLGFCCGCATCAVNGKDFDGYAVARDRDDASPIFDEGTLTVTVGGSVSGVIDVTGDVDTITVSLTAGQTYLFSLVGSGGTPVTDTLLSIFAPGGSLLREDDDGGNGTFSLITITATATGTYTLTAESFSNPPDPGLGGWTLSVRQQGADSVPNTIPSAVDAIVGTTTYGFLETGSDRDVYRVTLTEGFLYNFAVAGGHDYSTPGTVGPLELDTVITIFDSSGNVVATNDDIDAGAGSEDLSSLTSFFAEASGTYYVEVRSFNDPGGYVLDITQADLSGLDPLDAIDWGGIDNAVDNSDTLLIYFATAGQTFDGETSLGWTAYEQQQALAAFQTYSQFADLDFAITTNSAIADFKLVTVTSTEFLGYFNPPGETNAGVGVFAINGSGWDRTGATGGLAPGGYGWITLIHEFGHGLGMAHPHDNGGGSEVMPGVTGPFGSYGIFDLNQGVYTTMSYNDGWQLHPDADNDGFPCPTR